MALIKRKLHERSCSRGAQARDEPLPASKPPTLNCNLLLNHARRCRRRSLLVVAALAIAGGGLAVRATRGGVGLSNDSFVYLSAARHLVEGKGLLVSPCVSYEAGTRAAPGENPVTLTHFPPLYPAAVAALGRLGLDLREAARWLNVVLFSVNVAIVGLALIGRSRTGISPLVATLWIVCSFDLIYLHVMAWSEPLSLALGFGGLTLLGSWLDGQGPRTAGLLLAAALAGLAAVTRYAGLVYVIVGVAGLLAIGSSPQMPRVRNALLFGGFASLPLLCVLIHNSANAGRVVNRRLEFHPPELARVGQLFDTLVSWVLPANLPAPSRTALGAGLVVGAIAIHFWFQRATPVRERRFGRGSPSRALGRLLTIFVPAYFIFVFASMTFVDRAIPINFRLLAPLHVAVAALAALAAEDLATRYHLPRRLRNVILVALAGLLLVKYSSVTRFADLAGMQGLELSMTERKSSLLACVRGLPPGVRIYSNLSAMTSFLADRPVWPLASAQDADDAMIAYYNSGPPAEVPAEIAALRRFSHPVQSTRDGIIYSMRK
jgi:hypothetical protein